MGNETFILDSDGNVIAEPDTLRWGQWLGTHDKERIVERTEIAPNETVSTVFLGLNHRFSGKGPPVLWETMVFGGPEDGRQERYSSREAALKGHQRWVKRRKLAHKQAYTDEVLKRAHDPS